MCVCVCVRVRACVCACVCDAVNTLAFIAIHTVTVHVEVALIGVELRPFYIHSLTVLNSVHMCPLRSCLCVEVVYVLSNARLSPYDSLCC